MIKKLIPHYYIDEDSNEKSIIHDNLFFSVNPYLDKLEEDDQKMFRTLDSNEQVYTEDMRLRVIVMVDNVKDIINNKLDALQQDIKELPFQQVGKPAHPYFVLQENYIQQLKALRELRQIFILANNR